MFSIFILKIIGYFLIPLYNLFFLLIRKINILYYIKIYKKVECKNNLTKYNTVKVIIISLKEALSKNTWA